MSTFLLNGIEAAKGTAKMIGRSVFLSRKKNGGKKRKWKEGRKEGVDETKMETFYHVNGVGYLVWVSGFLRWAQRDFFS